MKQKILNLPNILTIIRFVLVPIAIIFFFSKLAYNQLIAGGIVLLAYVTDIFDGYLARHNNQVTDFGKIMDPAADKFMQLSLLICLSIKMPIIIPALVFLLIKDLSLAVGATILYKKGVVISANWFGKTASFITLFSLLAILIIPFENFVWGNIVIVVLICITILSNLAAVIAYICTFFDLLKKTSN